MLDLLRRIHDKHGVTIAVWPAPDGRWQARATIVETGKADETVKNWTGPVCSDDQTAAGAADKAFVSALDYKFGKAKP